ncbi:MAG TPA: nitroreductase family deazaflavin-dependent oxidoreductase [Candidatus Dormibacteraeota bacterium]|nr:nitroreductase family deazaflavin-dependent oxidoreductase [Candidatus Dormibacteraeota bacterium]
MSQPHALVPDHAPRAVTIANPIVRGLARAGLPLGPNVLLTVRGRTSGLPRTFPVALMHAGDRLLVQSPYGEVQWVRNLRADPAAEVARGRRRTPVRAVELPPEIAGPLLREATAPFMRNRLIAAFARLFIPIRPDAPAEAYVEHARRHPTFELVVR